MSRAAHVLGLISLLALTPALAQAPARQDSAGLAWLAQTVNGRALIRVSGRWGTAHLSAPRLAGDTLTFAAADPAVARPLSLDAVDRIQVRGHAAGSGALVGAGVGLVAGIVFDATAVRTFCDGGCSNETGGSIVIAAASTAAGALLGALIGAAIPKWHTVYESPE